MAGGLTVVLVAGIVPIVLDLRGRGGENLWMLPCDAWAAALREYLEDVLLCRVVSVGPAVLLLVVAPIPVVFFFAARSPAI